MSQISTVVSSTLGTVICPIRGLYSRLVISDRCKIRNYPNRVLSKSCRPPAGAGGQWADLGRKLRQTNLFTPFSANVIWLYDPGSSELFSLLRQYRNLQLRCWRTPFPLPKGGTYDPTSIGRLRSPFRVSWDSRPQRHSDYRYFCTRCSRTFLCPGRWWDLRSRRSDLRFSFP